MVNLIRKIKIENMPMVPVSARTGGLDQSLPDHRLFLWEGACYEKV